MKKIQQDMMCVLLHTLLDKKLITQDIHDKSREKILGSLDWPEFFCYAESDGKGGWNGYT
jgi:hypothetical protein